MKTPFFSFLFLVLGTTFVLAGSGFKKIIKASVDRAVIYRSGATCFAGGEITLQPGMNEIVFDGVSPLLDQQSVLAYGNGGFTITEAHYHADYSEPVKDTSKQAGRLRKQIRLCNDSISDLSFRLEEIRAKLATLELEKHLLTNNRYIRGETKKDSLTIFKDAVELMRTRMGAITSEVFRLKREEQNIQGKMDAVSVNMNAWQEALTILGNGYGESKISHQIVVNVLADVAGPAKISVSFFVAQAGWTPNYDIKAFGNKSKLELVQHASVWQQSGLDWSKVALTLSTGSPGLSFTKPVLNPWLLQQARQVKRPIKGSVDHLESTKHVTISRATKAGSTYIHMEDMERPAVNDAPDVLYADDFTEKSYSGILTEYQIKLPYDLPNGNIPISVVVSKSELPSLLEYYCVPKLDQSVYLQAKVTGWEDMDLIPGVARIYFDGSYSGRIQFDPQSIGDTLQIDLGKDPAWVITRKKLKETVTEKVLAEQKILAFQYQIQVRNAKAIGAKLIIEDQVPLSNNPNAEVKLTNSGKASHNTETGLLRWELDVKPRETKKLDFGYEIRHDKEVVISRQ